MARDRLVRRALTLSIVSIIISGIVGGIAVVVGLTTGSPSLLGFGFDAAFDSAASVALVLRFRTEAHQPHRAERVEKLAESVVGAVLIVLALYLDQGAVRALATGAVPETTLLGSALLLVSVAVLPPLALAKYRVAKSLESGALRADRILTGIAALLAAIALVSLGLAEVFVLVLADSIRALVVAVVLVREGWASLQAVRRTHYKPQGARSTDD